MMQALTILMMRCPTHGLVTVETVDEIERLTIGDNEHTDWTTCPKCGEAHRFIELHVPPNHFINTSMEPVIEVNP